ncbi:MAG: carboxypeptidase-like regulatory domain-containing protein [Bacteroidetes bacterium]|nr:carboxypeptidase-like regulatory domain-containing protein [Bacteroidota bacterium]
MIRTIIFICLVNLLVPVFAQTPTQTVRGRVFDADSKTSLPGANITLMNSDPLIGTTTDANGNFILENVPVGRRSFRISYIGYKPIIKPEILISSGKETILSVELSEDAVVGVQSQTLPGLQPALMSIPTRLSFGEIPPKAFSGVWMASISRIQIITPMWVLQGVALPCSAVRS